MGGAQFQGADLNTLSHYIPTKRALYDILSNGGGLYLPAHTPQAMNGGYLIQVMGGGVKGFLRAGVGICHPTQSHPKRGLLGGPGKA